MITAKSRSSFRAPHGSLISVTVFGGVSRRNSASLASTKAMLLVLFLILILLPSLALAQTNLTDVLGIPPDASAYPIPGVGFVNLRNGNLHIEIPLRVVKDRNGSPVTTSLTYDNSVWEQVQVPTQSGGPVSAWSTQPPPFTIPASGTVYLSTGVQISTSPQYYGFVTYTTTYINGCNQPPTDPGAICAAGNAYSNWEYIDAHGTIHPVASYLVTGDSSLSVFGYPSSFQALTTDGSGYWMVVTNSTAAIVYDMHGNQVRPIVDTNGNFPPSGFKDKLGRSIVLPAGFTSSTETINVSTNFGLGELVGSETVLSSLTLPDGRSYTFQYDDAGNPAQKGHYGSLTSITLPTRGQILITSEVSTCQSVNSVACAHQFVVKNITTPDGAWSFAYSPTTYLVTATAPVDPATDLASQTTLSVPGFPSSPSEVVSTYSGTATGTPLRQVTIQNPGLPTSITTTLDNGQSSSVSYTYADGCTPRVSSKKEYDFTDSLVRETDENYYTSASDNTNLTNLCNGTTPPSWTDPFLQNNHHITDIPSSITVYGSGGCCSSPIAQTTYTYDSTSLSTTSGSLGHSVFGLSDHDDTDYGSAMTVRGNPTVIQQMTAQGSLTTTKTNHYNILGEIVSSVDGDGNTTTFDYTDSWNDSSCISSSVFAYPTTITNAKSQVSETTYNSCDGSIASSKDQNDINASRAGTVYTYDGLQRVTSLSYPDGGAVSTGYGGSAVPEVITATVAASPSPSQVSSTTLDGLGRAVTAVAANGATVTTTYDSRGRVHTVSNPYFSTAGGVTTYDYDALNRITKQLNSDGVSSQTWGYSGGTLTYTNENGSQWQRTSDALGRLTQVVEPSLLVTNYTYDVLDNLLKVSQLGIASNGDVPRTRTFNYDALSRLLCASNPENATAACPAANSGTYVAGTTGYSYDANGNVQTRTDARGVTANYSYDSLNRLIGKTYTNAPAGTLSNCYQYDTATNGIGRLGAEWTQTGACPQTAPASGYQSGRSFGSYDAMGRLLREQRCVAGYCTSPSFPSQPTANCTSLSSPVGLQYCYDLAGDLLGYSNGVTTAAAGNYPQQALLFSQTFNAAGQLATVGSSWSDTTHPASLFSNASYAPNNALSSWLLGTGLWTARQYDNRLRVCNQQSAQQQISPLQCP